MSISSAAATSREQARQKDGKFGHQPHAEAEVDLASAFDADKVSRLLGGGEYSPEAETMLLGEVRSIMGNRPDYLNDMVFIYQDESLDDQEVDLVLAGNMDTAYDWAETSGRWWERRDESAEETARELLGDLSLDFDALHPDIQDAVRSEITYYDTSDPMRQLLQNTPDKLMRASVTRDLIDAIKDGEPEEHSQAVAYNNLVVHGIADDYADVVAARSNLIEQELLRSGAIDKPLSPQDREAVESMVEEGPSTWTEYTRLDAIWFGGVQDAALPMNDGESVSKTLTAPDGMHVVLLDTGVGTGCDAELSAPLTIHLNNDRHAFLDSPEDSPTYGWDETAGVYHPAYRADLRVGQ